MRCSYPQERALERYAVSTLSETIAIAQPSRPGQPVEEPPGGPKWKPPIEEPVTPPEKPPEPDEPPVEVPWDTPPKPPIEVPPAEDPNSLKPSWT